MSRTARINHKNSSKGLTLIEIVISMSIFLVFVLPVAITLLRGMEHREFSFQNYRAMNSLRDKAAEIQETANLKQDLAAQEGIGAIYAKYDNKTFSIPEVSGGQISVTCFADEATVPTALGGPQDLNFDNDAQDNLGNQSNGTDLKLVPMTLTITFGDDTPQQTLTIHRLITKTVE